MAAAQNANTGEDSTAVERGVQYPADSIAEALGMLEKVKSAVGMGAAKRELIANALGYKTMSGHAARRLGALSHYGLIERAGKGAARISPLGKAILMPTSDAERARSIVDAVKMPNLFATLIAKHAGHALPTMLANLLAREHGVNASVAESAANTFRESVEYAGLLRNGVLFAEIPATEEVVSGARPDGSSKPSMGATDGRKSDPDREDDTVIDDAETATFTVVLDPRRRRLAKITMPIEVTARELKNIEAWVAYMKLTVHDDETPDISAN